MSTLLNHQACLDVEACWYSTLLNRCCSAPMQNITMATGVGHCGACSNYETSLVFSFSFLIFMFDYKTIHFFRFFDYSIIRQVHEK